MPSQTIAALFTLRCISSMATKSILAQLAAAYTARTGQDVSVQFAGGIDAAKRVQTGESFDVVLLAADAIKRLIASGHLVQGSRVDWTSCSVAIAVPSTGAVPAIGSEAALKQAVLDAPSISYSTGPSGTYLAQLFERWGITDVVQPKLVVPPPGTSVGSLVACGHAALGFQQLSELLNVHGVQVVGNLPSEVAFITTFSAAISADLDAQRQQAAQHFVAFLNAPEADPVKQQHGMTPFNRN